VAAEGPGPDDYATYELHGAAVVARQVGAPPEHADIVYAHPPTAELPEIIAMAQQVGAKAIWCQTARAKGAASSSPRDWNTSTNRRSWMR